MQKKQLQALTLEQKCALLSGGGTFTTRALPKAGIPSITLSDGPNGVRKQAGAADHLGLNPSVPATCFPTAVTVACSWDPALGEEIGKAMGDEAAAQEVAVLLGPGLNTKRSPLCGHLARRLCAGHPERRHRRLPQALRRQQPGAAPHGVGLRAGRTHPAGDLPDRL